MLNSGKKIRALRDKKNNILTLVLSEKKILNETNNHNPPLQVIWLVPKMNTLFFSWGKQNLTILGKIMIIKALVIPIFTCFATACVVPGKYRKGIESKCFKCNCYQNIHSML
jgi:hypothetical protein